MHILLIFVLPFLYLFLFYIFKILKTTSRISLYSRTNDFSFETILNFVFKTPYTTPYQGTLISIKSTIKKP